MILRLDLVIKCNRCWLSRAFFRAFNMSNYRWNLAFHQPVIHLQIPTSPYDAQSQSSLVDRKCFGLLLSGMQGGGCPLAFAEIWWDLLGWASLAVSIPIYHLINVSQWDNGENGEREPWLLDLLAGPAFHSKRSGWVHQMACWQNAPPRWSFGKTCLQNPVMHCPCVVQTCPGGAIAYAS